MALGAAISSGTFNNVRWPLDRPFQQLSNAKDNVQDFINRKIKGEKPQLGIPSPYEVKIPYLENKIQQAEQQQQQQQQQQVTPPPTTTPAAMEEQQRLQQLEQLSQQKKQQEMKAAEEAARLQKEAEEAAAREKAAQEAFQLKLKEAEQAAIKEKAAQADALQKQKQAQSASLLMQPSAQLRHKKPPRKRPHWNKNLLSVYKKQNKPVK